MTFHKGFLYLSDQIAGSATTGIDEVRRIDVRTGQLTNIAGADSFGFTPDGGRALGGPLGSVAGIAVDKAGNVVISDSDILVEDRGIDETIGNNRVRVVATHTGTFYGQRMTAGRIYTIAGTGTFGFSGDGGQAISARLAGPGGLTVDPAGNVVVVDAANNRIRVIAEKTGRFYGVAMVKGRIYTVAGGGSSLGQGVPAASAKLSLANVGPDEVATQSGVRIDHAGNLVIADSLHDSIRVIAASTGRFYGHAMIVGHIYTIAGTTGTGRQGNGVPAIGAALAAPEGVAIDGAGNVVIAQGPGDTNGISQPNGPERIVAVKTGTFYGQKMKAGDIYTLTGVRDEPAVDSAGNVVTAVSSKFAVNTAGSIQVLAARSGHFYGKQMTAGHHYVIAGVVGTNPSRSASLRYYSGEGGPATSATIAPVAAVPDSAGLLIADSRDDRVLLDARTSGRFFGRSVKAGHLYTLAGTGNQPGLKLPDAIKATRAPIDPDGLAVDKAGNIIVAQPYFLSFTVNRFIGGGLFVIAARNGTFYGRRMVTGDIYLVGGGGKSQASGVSAKGAAFGDTSVFIDQHGNLVIGAQEATSVDASPDPQLVRVLATRAGTFYGQHMKAMHIYTIAGVRNGGSVASGVPALTASIEPGNIAIDRSGDVLLADAGIDTSFFTVRVVAETSGTKYGQHMTAGDIYTIAGGGTAQSPGGKLALQVRIAPAAVAVDPSGNVLISQRGSAAPRTDSALYVVPVRSGKFYGKQMTAEHIYIIAGGKEPADTGDSGPATHAALRAPRGIALWPHHGIVIADDLKLRLITGAG